MNHKFLQALSQFSLIEPNNRVVVALSGGADSVALLHALISIREKYNLTIYACHLNHLIRGEEADRDENFVRQLCDKLGIELFVKRVDVPALSAKQKVSLELAGRNARYEFFDELSQDLGAKVATAHTASDNVETVLYNISRGSSLNGLCGIRPQRGYIIRPLILATRQDVESYCESHSLSFVTDSTNLSDEYTRNNIRHNAVPTLMSVNPELHSCVSRMCEDMAQVKDYLDEISILEINNCRTDYGYDCKKLSALNIAVLRNALYIICRENSVDPTHRHIELIISAMESGGCVELCADATAVCKQGVLRIVRKSDAHSIDRVVLKDSDLFEYISAEEIKNVNNILLNNCISCDIITDDTVVRTRKEGDTFTFFDRDVTKSLKKLLNELKIPAEKRSQLLLVANGSTVLWLQGVGTSKHGRVDKHSSGAYILRGTL